MKQKIQIGVIGGGRWAQNSHLPALKKLDDVEITAISTSKIESAKIVAEKFGIKEAVQNPYDIISSKEIDAVIVLSPPKTHYEYVKAALENNKHVLCEGPLAMNCTEAKKMLELAESKGLVHGCTRPKLYIDGDKKVKELIQNGTLGKLNCARLDWRPTVWLDETTPFCWRHDIAESPPLLAVVPTIMLIDLFGEVESVKAQSDILVKERHCPVEKKEKAVTAPDFFQSMMKFKSGLSVSLQAGAGNNALDENGLYISGSKASLIWKWTLPNKIFISKQGEKEVQEVPYSANFMDEWTFDQEFIEAIQKKTLPPHNFTQALYEMEIIEKLGSE